MPWIVGLVDKKELDEILAAGYENEVIDAAQVANMPNRETPKGLSLVGVWVEGDVSDYLLMEEE